ncbi:ATP-dependent Clp protease adapter protein CLPS1, chloroplastic-like [Durio zibethinus]|uniref:ATP-dependent Clp protease adapter protein CLPS1, chloroplastic-like n=1 Tax=Durio zibethinus TaxID=66656 RepID=A0A6P6AAB9_DURZI|nr:ATP-dependent Clp protease adapter protein CLPS1, chloroplastic-like [Durio zibethinus]
MAVVAGTVATSSWTLVKSQRLPSAPSLRKFCGGNESHPGGKMVMKFMGMKARFGSFTSGGAGVLERPGFDQSQFEPSTKVLEGGDIGRLRNKKGIGSGGSYRVLLVDDAGHSEKLVAKVLPQVVPSVTPDDARKLFHVSRENGVAVVIVTVKEHAEFYSQMMIRGGLRSTIEPDSSLM